MQLQLYKGSYDCNKIFVINSALVILVALNSLWNLIGIYITPGPSLPYIFLVQGILMNILLFLLGYLILKKVPLTTLCIFILILCTSTDALSNSFVHFDEFIHGFSPITSWDPGCTQGIIILAQLIFSGSVILYSLYLMIFKHKSLKEVAI